MRVLSIDSPRVPEPVTGNPLDVIVNGGWRLPVRCMSSAVTGDVVLEPLAAGVQMPGGALSCDAVLEWRSVLGLVRREGQLRAHEFGLELTGVSDAVIVQRRNHARVHSTVRTLIRTLDRDDEFITHTVDLSVGGMLIERAAALQVGEDVEFCLGLEQQQDLRGRGSVVRATRFGHRAIRFDELDRREEARLARFVFAEEREGRSAAAYA